MKQDSCCCSVLLIGLGNIGFYYDRELPKDRFIHTHSRAIASTSAFNLCGAIDIDKKKITSFTNETNVPAWRNLSEYSSNKPPDLVVIAVPADQHACIITLVVQKFPNLMAILCEKPKGGNENDAKSIHQLSVEAGIPVFVNYIRRPTGAIGVIQKKIEAENPRKQDFQCVVRFGGSIQSTASHYLDLLGYLFGFPEPSAVAEKNEGVWKLNFGACEALFIQHQLDVSHSSFDLMGENFRVRYDFSGRNVSVDPVFVQTKVKKYAVGRTYYDQFDKYQQAVYRHLKNALAGKPNLLCRSEEALRTWDLINQMEEVAAK